MWYYAGSRKADYSTGTVSISEGSSTLTGVGTAWLANVDKGGLLNVSAGPSSYRIVVASVDSNTQLTLCNPWPFAGGATGAGYLIRATDIHNILDRDGNVPPGAPELDIVPFPAVTALGVAGRRLLASVGDKVFFSEPDDPQDFRLFHLMPDGAPGRRHGGAR